MHPSTHIDARGVARARAARRARLAMSRAASRVAPALARRATRGDARRTRRATARRRATRDADDARRRRATTGSAAALDALERVLRRRASRGAARGEGCTCTEASGRGKTALADATSDDGETRGRRHRRRADALSRVHGGGCIERCTKERRRGRAARAGGGADPLWTMGARRWRRRRAGKRCSCVDEMEISDVADAMVIKRLMEAYFAHGGALVTTSNCAPERLYDGGINRAAFAPFAETLRARCEVVDLDARESVDYRRRARDDDANDGAIFVGDDDATRERLSRAWDRFTRDARGEREVDADVVVSATRRLRAKARVGAHARFAFDDICGRRSRAAPSDYVALAERFKVICVEDVPRLPIDASENEARRFINLIDVLYEHRVVLLANLWASPDDLFDGADGADDDLKAFRELTPRERTRIENAFRSELSVTSSGGSSGRSTTMLAPELEWSATGRVGASLAHVSGVNFTRAASPRAKSRLHHMRSSAYFNSSP